MTEQEFEEVINLDVGRGMRTPKTEAARAINGAYQTLQAILTENTDANALFESIMENMWANDDSSGDLEREAYEASLDASPVEAGKNFFLSALCITCAYSVEAIREEEAGNAVTAWSLAGDARYWAGLINGYSMTVDNRKTVVKMLARQYGKNGADKRHAPMAKVKEMALSEYRAKKWPSSRQASKALKDIVFAYSKTIDGANMSEDCAQERIYEWILASLKEGNKAPV